MSTKLQKEIRSLALRLFLVADQLGEGESKRRSKGQRAWREKEEPENGRKKRKYVRRKKNTKKRVKEATE